MEDTSTGEFRQFSAANIVFQSRLDQLDAIPITADDFQERNQKHMWLRVPPGRFSRTVYTVKSQLASENRDPGLTYYCNFLCTPPCAANHDYYLAPHRLASLLQSLLCVHVSQGNVCAGAAGPSGRLRASGMNGMLLYAHTDKLSTFVLK